MDIVVLSLLLLLFTGTTFTSLAELSISSVNPLRMQSLAEAGSFSAKTVLWIRQRTDLLFGTLLVANTVINVIIPVLMLRLLANMFHEMSSGTVDVVSVITATGVISILEITSKTMGTARAEKMALLTALPVRIVVVALYPAVFFFNLISNGITRMFGIDPKFEGYNASMDEMRIMIRSAAEQGHVNDDERKMMHRLSFLGELEARHVLVPRSDVVAFPRDITCKKLAAKIVTLPHSRYPIYGESLDDIIGILHARDLLACMDLADLFIIDDMLHPVHFVPPRASLSDILKKMREERAQLVVVVDEYGQTEGIITFEDIIEEIIGEIQDEFDHVGDAARQSLDGSIIIDGRSSIHNINADYMLNLPTETITIGGMLLHRIGRLPLVGEKIRVNCYELEVLKMTGRKITSIAIRHLTIEDGETLGDEFE